MDVAIVGGGYTGLWTALALRERGPHLRIAVLEAESCGSGGSGRNGGFLHGYWEMFGKLSAILGEDRALTVAAAGSQAQREILRFCADRNEDLWLESAGINLAATSTAQLAAVSAALRASSAIPEQFRPRERPPTELAHGGGFRSAAYFPEGATVQPARLLGALKSAAMQAGVEIYEATPVANLRPGAPNSLRTPLGMLRANDVVLAGNAWMSQYQPYARHLTNLGSYAIVTEPIPEVLDQLGLRRGFAAKDARMFLHWARTTHDDRIVVGTGAGPMSYGGRVGAVHTTHTASMVRCVNALRKFFPEARDARVEHAWGGPIDMSADRIPFFGTLPESTIHYGLGYSGHGVNATWIGGQVLSSLVLGADDRWTNSPFCDRKVPRLPPEPLRYLGGKLIHRSSLAVEDSLDRGERPSGIHRLVATLPRLFGLRIGLR
ncbi:FAD-dependent oxidoreductase [Tamaricihabitans halophyticus]|uniref:FAD-dependent oxidoreductase n=1 Tax=Tamaricihabitans halophyticus TaxID=1262583 RepID=UPI0014046840|nr:FAD-dependent oxidoreductase [Tamaricihabitans halophyticus]